MGPLHQDIEFVGPRNSLSSHGIEEAGTVREVSVSLGNEGGVPLGHEPPHKLAIGPKPPLIWVIVSKL